MKRNAIAWVALVVSTAALIGSQNWSRSVPAAPQGPQIPQEGIERAKELSSAFEAVAEFVAPSVVQISVERSVRMRGLPRGPDGEELTPEEMEEFLERFRRFFPDGGGLDPEDFFRFEPQQAPPGTGSGFVYDAQGHILTNNHVVEDAEEDGIQVVFSDGSMAEAEVVGTDPATDVAVIKVDKSGLRPLPIGESDNLNAGQWVLAVGSPFGLSQTVTAGIISATNRNAVGILGQEGYEDFIQTDAAINPGNSGGPLVNIEGQVIGINSAIATRTRANAGVGFAIPITLASYIADSLIEEGSVRRARLGVVIQPLTPELAEPLGIDPELNGIFVQDVAPDSPASKAGLQPGDVLVGFKGEKIENLSDFRFDVAMSQAGESYELAYIREGQERTARVTLAPAEEVEIQALARRSNRRGPREAPDVSINRFGLAVQELTPEVAEQLGYEDDARGVVVRRVAPGSPADVQGIATDDLITQVIKDKKIHDVTDLDSFRELVGERDQVAVRVESPDGVSRFVPLSSEDSDEEN